MTANNGTGFNPNRNDDGTFANGQVQAESTEALTGDEVVPTDLVELVDYLEAQAASERAGVEAELQEIEDTGSSDGRDHERIVSWLASRDDDRYRLLVGAIRSQDALPTTPPTSPLDQSPMGVEGLDEQIDAAYYEMWDASRRAQTLTARSMARQLLAALPDAAYLDIEQDDENRGHMRPVSVRNAAGEKIVEDAVDWESEEPGRPDLSYITSQLDDDSESWNQFCVDVPGDDPFRDPPFRIDLRAASKAGE